MWIVPGIVFPEFWRSDENESSGDPEEPGSVADRITSENSGDLRSVDEEREQEDFNKSTPNSEYIGKDTMFENRSGTSTADPQVDKLAHDKSDIIGSGCFLL